MGKLCDFNLITILDDNFADFLGQIFGKIVLFHKIVRYNRVLFVITGEIYQENDLNQPNKYFCSL